jgi:hypothetical protein
MSELAAQLKDVDEQTGRAVIALLCLDAGVIADLPRPLVELVGTFVVAAGMTGKEEPSLLVEKTRAYIEARVPPAIRQTYERLKRDAIANGQSTSSAARTLLGIDEKRGPLDSGARPEGTVPASPLARFLVQKK